MTTRSRAIWLVAVLWLVPSIAVSVIFVSTTLRYVDGTERLPDAGYGYPSREAGNLNREFRVFPVASGCSGAIFPSLARRLERAIFAALFRAFGPMKGSYLGPYPTKEEAIGTLGASRSSISRDEWDSGAFRVYGRMVQVPASALNRVEIPSSARADVALVGPCLVVGFERGATREVHLIDLGGMGWFAVYRYG